MKIHESLENILVSQNKVLSTNGKEHLTQISAQATLVANHEQMIQESQWRSKEIQTACVHNLFQEYSKSSMLKWTNYSANTRKIIKQYWRAHNNWNLWTVSLIRLQIKSWVH